MTRTVVPAAGGQPAIDGIPARRAMPGLLRQLVLAHEAGLLVIEEWRRAAACQGPYFCRHDI